MDFPLCFSPSTNPASPSSYPNSIPPLAAAAAAAASMAAATAATASTATGPSSPGAHVGRGRDGIISVVSEATGAFLSGLLTCVFAIVGLFVGAANGAFVGLATESGLCRGAGIGAISGAVFSIDVAESSLVMWRARGPGIWSVLYVMDIIADLLSGRLIREKVGPAVQNVVRSEMSAVEAPFREASDIFETGGTTGMARATIEKIPRVGVTVENRIDPSGEKICCSVCLQDLQLGETVRSLPHCRHMFHLPCIDGWLIRHGSCPLCRRDL